MWRLVRILVRALGMYWRKVLEVDCKAIAADQARFLHIHVELPLEKPIKRARDCRHPISPVDGDKPYVEWLQIGNKLAKDPRGRKPLSPPWRNTEKANERARD
nr:hypothetical protein CFP56_10849 [Quercus suber]